MVNKLPPPRTYNEFIERVRCVAALHDCSFTSGARTVDHNAAVGGHVQSRHLLNRGGAAIDLLADDMSVDNRGRIVRTCMTFGLHALDEGDHVHVQPTPPNTMLWG